MEQERQVADADVQALELEGPLVHAALEESYALQRQVTGEEVEVHVVEREDAPGELGDLIDRDPAHDLRKDREGHRDDHDQPCDDRDQDLAGAARHPKHHTSTSTFMTGPPPSASSIPRWSDSRGMRRLTSGATGTAPEATSRIASSQSARA